MALGQALFILIQLHHLLGEHREALLALEALILGDSSGWCGAACSLEVRSEVSLGIANFECKLSTQFLLLNDVLLHKLDVRDNFGLALELGT